MISPYANAKPGFAPWQEDPDTADDWETGDWTYDDIVRMTELLAEGYGKTLDALRPWDEDKHQRVAPGQKGGGRFGTQGGGAVEKRLRSPAAILAGPPKPQAKAKAAPAGESTPEPKAEPKEKGKKPASAEDFQKAGILFRTRRNFDIAPVIETWNEEVGMSPEEFKQSFMGGLPGTMLIMADPDQPRYQIEGTIEDERGDRVGNFTREVDIGRQKAESVLFQIHNAERDGGIGKKLLAGNVETYEKLGITQVAVHAALSVGAYAWARYGYVPDQNSWNRLRSSIKAEIGSKGTGDPDMMEADEWAVLDDDTQEAVRQRWADESRSEFYENEVTNWRENGTALEDAKAQVANEFGTDMPDWASEALDELRTSRKEAGDPAFPFSNDDLYKAMEVNYEGTQGDGSDDPTVTWDDEVLDKVKAEGVDPDQMTLPEIDAPKTSELLTADMRQEIEDTLIDKFNDQAKTIAEDAEPPEYLADSVAEYQDEWWSQIEDRERYRLAENYDMHRVRAPPPDDEDEDTPKKEPVPGEDPVLAALDDRDPKAIWRVADSPRGKELLLGQDWTGKLDLKDPEAMARFKAYVTKGKKRAA